MHRLVSFISLAFMMADMCAPHAALGQKGDHCPGEPYDQSIACYSRLINSGKLKGGDLANALHNRGIAYFNKHELDRAIADLDRGLSIAQSPGSLATRGLAYQAKGELDRAITDFDRALLTHADPADVLFFRGRAYYEKGEIDRAIADLNQSLSLYPMERTRNLLERARTARPSGPLTTPPRGTPTPPAISPPTGGTACQRYPDLC